MRAETQQFHVFFFFHGLKYQLFSLWQMADSKRFDWSIFWHRFDLLIVSTDTNSQFRVPFFCIGRSDSDSLADIYYLRPIFATGFRSSISWYQIILNHVPYTAPARLFRTHLFVFALLDGTNFPFKTARKSYKFLQKNHCLFSLEQGKQFSHFCKNKAWKLHVRNWSEGKKNGTRPYIRWSF